MKILYEVVEYGFGFYQKYVDGRWKEWDSVYLEFLELDDPDLIQELEDAYQEMRK